MNKYTIKFVAKCPENGKVIEYTLKVRCDFVIQVERLTDFALSTHESFHEDLADELQEMFGGRQKLTAFHHGVKIETYRGKV